MSPDLRPADIVEGGLDSLSLRLIHDRFDVEPPVDLTRGENHSTMLTRPTRSSSVSPWSRSRSGDGRLTQQPTQRTPSAADMRRAFSCPKLSSAAHAGWFRVRTA